MSQIANDAYGRSVDFETDGVHDTYRVTGSGNDFTLSFPAGTDINTVYGSINNLIPG